MMKKFEALTIDVFGLIDEDCDSTLYEDELKIFWETLESMDLNEGQK